MATQLLTLDEYNKLAAKMIMKHPKLGKSYVTYDNIGLLTHYLIRADLAYDEKVTGFQGKVAQVHTFRKAWFNKIVMRLKMGNSRKNKKTARETVSITDLYDRDEYNGRRDTFCVQNYVSETEYRSKFKELEKLIDDYFSREFGKKNQAHVNGFMWSIKASPRTRKNSSTHIYMKMFYLEGKSYKQIAEKFNITASAVQNRIKTHAKNIDWDSLK